MSSLLKDLIDLGSRVTKVVDKDLTVYVERGDGDSWEAVVLLLRAIQSINKKLKVVVLNNKKKTIKIGDLIWWRGVPAGDLYPTFFIQIGLVGSKKTKVDGLPELKGDGKMALFVGSNCPHCRQAIIATTLLAMRNPDRKLLVINFDDMDEKFVERVIHKWRVTVVPFLVRFKRNIWDGEVVIVGMAEDPVEYIQAIQNKWK